jgi:transposase
MTSAKQKERELIIQLHKKKRSVRYIGEILDISKSKAAFWIQRYKQTNSLQDKPRSGKPANLTKQQLEAVKEVFHDFPSSKYGGERMGWITRSAIQYVKKEFGVEYGMRGMEKMLHKLGLRLITPRPQHRKGSKAARIVYRMDFKKNSRKNIWVAPSLISTK